MDVVEEVARVLRMEGEAILACAERLKQKPEPAQAIREAVQFLHAALENGGKIIVTGVGKSGKVGQKIAATLCSTGSLAVYLHPTEGLHGDLGMISPQDVVLAFSYTGNTDEIVRLLPSLKSLGVRIIGVGGNTQSKIAAQCDAWLDGYVALEACPHNLAPTSSTTLALALGDALAVALMQLRGFDAQAFAQFHPGGALGRRLHLKVSDLMHQGETVPTVGPQASMDEVVIVSSQKHLGAVLVVEGSVLLGIITDGDIRKALQQREGFFQRRAAEVMTRDPVVANSEMMAKAALDLMENRPSQISVLPVVDLKGHWCGLVRLHDLISSL
jgi:arabinose-5-phosphate isomerase